MDLLQMLQGQLSGSVVDSLSKTIRADKEQTTAAANGVFTTLLSALSRNAASPEKGGALLKALDRDHDGSALSDIMGLIGGGGGGSKQSNGLGMLDHILGGKTNNVVQMVSKASGLDFLKTGELMKLLAPMVMGTLGKSTRQTSQSGGGMDLGGLASILSGAVGLASKGNNNLGFIGKILDADGDGNVMDDIAGIGMKVFGNMFRK